MSESTRAYIYRICLAGLAILAAKAVITTDDLGLYGSLAAAILSIPPVALAVKNTSTSKES